MGFFDLFKKNKTDKLNYVSVLLHLSKIDGQMEDEEKKLIFDVANHLALTSDDFIKAVEMDKNAIILPTKKSEQIELLNDLVMLMLVDNKIDPREYLYCKQTALKLSIDPSIIDETIQVILETENILPNLNKDSIKTSYMLTRIAVQNSKKTLK